MGTREANATGFIDDCFGGTVEEFEGALIDKARQLSRSANFWRLPREKHEKRSTDERAKPLASYRGEELKNMEINFFGSDPAYHLACERFVYKRRARPASQREVGVPSRFGNRGKAIAGDRLFSGA
jgi:putative two-component system hydrogenase maturation factor HypX/HoxX